MFRIHDIIGNGEISQFIDNEELFDNKMYYSSSSDDEQEDIVRKIPESLRIKKK